MAWLSVGESHADLCQKLINHDILKQGIILDAFLATDRGDFVFPEDRLVESLQTHPQKSLSPNSVFFRMEAYQDRPYRRDFVHISAPHMYATVLEALSLRAGDSFLNVGSGSGYLSCLAASVLGERGLVQGIELNPSTAAHSRICCSIWREKMLSRDGRRDVCRITVVEGDAFELDIAAQVTRCRFDRVYIGASCPESLIRQFLPLLRAGGVLVAPVEETHELVRIERKFGDVFDRRDVTAVRFAPLVYPTRDLPSWTDRLPSFYRHHRLNVHDDVAAAVTATPAENVLVVPSSVPSDGERLCSVQTATLSFVLPAEMWRPSAKTHRCYPTEFREAVYSLLLCVSSHRTDGGRRSAPQNRVPVDVWLTIVSFMTREWFSRQPTIEELLRAELMAERARCRQLEVALSRTDSARASAEREVAYLRSAIDRVRPSERPRVAVPLSPWFVQSQYAADELTSDSDEDAEETVADTGDTEASDLDVEGQDEDDDDGEAPSGWNAHADGTVTAPLLSGDGDESRDSGTPAQSSVESTETPRSSAALLLSAASGDDPLFEGVGEEIRSMATARLWQAAPQALSSVAPNDFSEGPTAEALELASVSHTSVGTSFDSAATDATATDATVKLPLPLRGSLKRPWTQDALDPDDVSVGANRRPRCGTLGDLTDEDFGDA